MTERIDLDELEAGEGDQDAPNPGDWFWREEGDPDDEPEAVTDVKTDVTTGPNSAMESDADENETDAESASPSAGSGPMPRVPRENEGKPAGVPMESGGAGAGAGTDAGADASADASPEASAQTGASEGAGTDAPASAGEESATEASEAAGPHGGGADDMTLAFTYGAATRLADFGRVAADASAWADWLGIVGDVPAHVLNKFQRDRNVDLDFFNGSARGPAERLAAIDRHSMFYAERMVVVGVEGDEEAIAENAGWEFVPLAEAAGKAGWDVED